MAAAMDHLIEGPDGLSTVSEAFPDHARLVDHRRPRAGHAAADRQAAHLRLVGARSVAALRDQVAAAAAGANHTGWEGLLADQRAYLDDFWERSDVEIEGDSELQQAIRFGALPHPAGRRPRRAARDRRQGPHRPRATTGTRSGTRRCSCSRCLTYTAPRAAADALRWRQQTLDLARERARTLGLRGAAFPWRTIRGQECSSYWPAGTAAFHINADIADAVSRYQSATDDADFEHTVGIELLVETARLWRSLGHHDATGAFRIDGVTGPDEYSAVADNNVYTNLMAQRNLHAAADAVERHPRRAAKLEVDEEEAASWRDAAADMVVAYDEALGVHPQSEGFTSHQTWDFEHIRPEQYPLLLHFPYFDLYRKQVVKQADLVLALFACGDCFTPEEKLRDFEYYERLTVRDSSLSACTQAVIAAEVGHVELAYDYFGEAALMDLDDLEHNTRDGIHIASVAGTLDRGRGRLRRHARPRRPSSASAPGCRGRSPGSRSVWPSAGRRLRVEVDAEHARY